MNSLSFLKGFIRFSGILEIVFGIAFLFMHVFCDFLSLECLPFFNLFAGIELVVLGFLLFISAYDIDRYLIIIIVSCVFRYIMAGPEIYTILSVAPFRSILIAAVIYDYLSASLTLYLLWKGQFLPCKKKANKPLSDNMNNS